MDSPRLLEQDDSFPAFRRFARSKRTNVEQCNLCSLELYAEHPHLLEPEERQIHCACDPCAILFSNQGDLRYKRAPRDIRFLHDFRLMESSLPLDAWDEIKLDNPVKSSR